MPSRSFSGAKVCRKPKGKLYAQRVKNRCRLHGNDEENHRYTALCYEFSTVRKNLVSQFSQKLNKTAFSAYMSLERSCPSRIVLHLIYLTYWQLNVFMVHWSLTRTCWFRTWTKSVRSSVKIYRSYMLYKRLEINYFFWSKYHISSFTLNKANWLHTGLDVEK
jgi:hypothetical protein